MSLKRYPDSEEILAPDFKGCWRWAVPFTTTISDVPVAWKAPYIMKVGMQILTVSWIQQSSSLSPTRWRTQAWPSVVQAEPRLISKCHMSPVLVFPVWCLCVHACRRWRWSGLSLGHVAARLVWHPVDTKHLWTMRTETWHPGHLISYTLIPDAEGILFPLMIWRSARSCLGAVILNRCPCGL